MARTLAPRDPYAAVRRSLAREVTRYIADGTKYDRRFGTTWGAIIDHAYRVSEAAWQATGTALPTDGILADITAAREGAEAQRRAALHAAAESAREEWRIESARRSREMGW